MTAQRHVRHANLANVGEAGQKRLSAATVEVGDAGFAGVVAARYLSGAGVGRVVVAHARTAEAAAAIDPGVAVEVRELAPRTLEAPRALGLESAAASAMAAGAYHALVEIRAALGMPPVAS